VASGSAAPSSGVKTTPDPLSSGKPARSVARPATPSVSGTSSGNVPSLARIATCQPGPVTVAGGVPESAPSPGLAGGAMAARLIASLTASPSLARSSAGWMTVGPSAMPATVSSLATEASLTPAKTSWNLRETR
jgi:hypothetical protein